MKLKPTRQLTRALTSSLTTSLTAAVLASTASFAVHAQSDAATVFERYVTAVNAGDMAAIRDMIAPEVERSDYPGCKPEMDNKTCLAHYIQTTVIGVQGRIKTVSSEVRGDTVHAKLEVASNLATQFGQQRIVGTDIVRVGQGRITAFRFVPDFGDEQTASIFGRLGIGPRAVKPGAAPAPGAAKP